MATKNSAAERPREHPEWERPRASGRRPVLIEEGPWSAWYGPKVDWLTDEPPKHSWTVRARSTGTADPFTEQRIVATDLTLDEARLLSAAHEMRELTRLVASYFEGSIPGTGKGSELGVAARRILGRWGDG